MKRILKYSFAIIVTIFGLLAAWYGFGFLQYKNEIDHVLVNSDKMYKDVDSSLYKLSVIAEGEKGIVRWASQRAYWDIAHHKEDKNLTRQLNSLLWFYCIQLHYNQKEIFKLWCHYSLYIDGYGLNNAALKYFGKSIKELSLEEKAAIVAMVKSPSRYEPGSEKSIERIKYILERFHNS